MSLKRRNGEKVLICCRSSSVKHVSKGENDDEAYDFVEEAPLREIMDSHLEVSAFSVPLSPVYFNVVDLLFCCRNSDSRIGNNCVWKCSL